MSDHHPSIALDAQAVIAETCAHAAQVAGVPLETAYEGAWSREHRRVTSVRLVGIGTPTQALSLPHCLPRGCVYLHTHATGPLIPSPEDLQVAINLDTFGVGFGIVSDDGQRLLMVREPKPLPLEAPPIWKARLGRWHAAVYERAPGNFTIDVIRAPKTSARVLGGTPVGVAADPDSSLATGHIYDVWV